MAEYYLKVFLKCSIEENSSIEEARVRLSVGLPTDQTIDFFKGLLNILRDSVLGDISDASVYSKRELLIPLLASLSNTKHNKKLYSTRLKISWMEKYEDSIIYENKIPKQMIEDFPITKKTLTQIELLAKNIIEDEKIYIIDEPKKHNLLYKDEIISINNNNTHEIDKWLSLITGNVLCTDEDNKFFFNRNVNAFRILDMLINYNNLKGDYPRWSSELFMGLNVIGNSSIKSYGYMVAYKINFSYSYFSNISFHETNFSDCKFNDVTFDNVHITSSTIYRASFDNIIVKGELDMSLTQFMQGVFLPPRLVDMLKDGASGGLITYGPQFTTLEDVIINISDFRPLRGIIRLLLMKGNNFTTIKESFKFVDDDIESIDLKDYQFDFRLLLDQVFDEISSNKID